jgi:glycerol-3-phosphate dehydrogenase (NAD+)
MHHQTRALSSTGLHKVDGRPLSTLINEKHENVKYLPGVQLGDNVRAEPDIVKAIKDATALVIVLPYQVCYMRL